MSTRYFVDPGGTYLGGFDGAEPPRGSVEVPAAPEDGRQKWDGRGWSPKPSDDYALTKDLLIDRMTNPELVQFAADRELWTLRQREKLANMQSVRSGTPTFAFLQTKLTTLFGDARAAEILAKP